MNYVQEQDSGNAFQSHAVHTQQQHVVILNTCTLRQTMNLICVLYLDMTLAVGLIKKCKATLLHFNHVSLYCKSRVVLLAAYMSCSIRLRNCHFVLVLDTISYCCSFPAVAYSTNYAHMTTIRIC